MPFLKPSRLATATLFLTLGVLNAATASASDDPWLVLPGGDGPGNGKHVVLVTGDEEYRSEEAMPQLAKILSKRHGFKCTVLFAIAKDGTIDPNCRDNIPGLDALKSADLMILFTRFRDLPDAQTKPFADYLATGRPMIGLRTATHAFAPSKGSAFEKYSYKSREDGWDGGFGRQVFGETWIDHHGKHGKQSTRGVLAPGAEGHPILRGIKSGDIWGPSDVYKVRLPLPGDSKPLVLGEILEGMKPDDPAVKGPQNEPMMPIAWVKSYKGDGDKSARVFTTTMGAAQDFSSEGVRRLLVNATYWTLGLDPMIPEKSDVRFVGEYKPSPFRNDGFKKGVRPSDLAAE